MNVVEATPRTERAPKVIIYRPENSRRGYSSGAGVSTVIQPIEVEFPPDSDLSGEWLIKATRFLPTEGSFVLGSGRLSLAGGKSPTLRRTLYQPSNAGAEQLLRLAFGKTINVTPKLGGTAISGTLLGQKSGQPVIQRGGNTRFTNQSLEGIVIFADYQRLELPPELEVRPTHSLSFGVRVAAAQKFEGEIRLETTNLDWKVLYRGTLSSRKGGEGLLSLSGEALINNNSGLDITGAEIVLADARADAADEDTLIEGQGFTVASAMAPAGGGRPPKPEQEKVGAVNTFALPGLWDLPSGSSQGISFLPETEIPVQLQPLLKRPVWWGEEARYNGQEPWVVRESMFVFNPLEGALPSGSLDIEEKHPTHDLRIVTSKGSLVPEVAPHQNVRVTLGEIGDITAKSSWTPWSEAFGENDDDLKKEGDKDTDQPLAPASEEAGPDETETTRTTLDLADYAGDRNRLIVCQVLLTSHQKEPVTLRYLQDFGKYRLVSASVAFPLDNLSATRGCQIDLQPGELVVVSFILEAPLDEDDD